MTLSIRSLGPVCAALAAAIMVTFIPLSGWAAPVDLNKLLEQTRDTRQTEAKANLAREKRFMSERDKQASLLADIRKQLGAERNRGVELSTEFDGNEEALTELQVELDGRSGNLGEMFGVVRQVANDFSSVIRGSIITAQYPDREAFIVGLSETRLLPSIGDLERFWFELQREMTETGNVVRYDTQVLTPAGTPTAAEVIRVGPFSAVTDGQYLQYLPSQKQLAIMARQPGGHFQDAAKALEEAREGYVKTVADPTRGVLLSIYAQRPTFLERIHRGEAVGYVIIAVGLIGAVLALYQFGYLTMVRAKVKRQLKTIDTPMQDNPLGRVLASFKGDARQLEEDAEVAELRLSEAVLKETPKLERFQPFLRLAVAAGPLLGLIGTVMGMIITFQSITESGSSDPKLMANGISAAMIATLLGLGIAVPLLFANAWLASLSRAVTQILDEQCTGLLAERLEGQHHA